MYKNEMKHLITFFRDRFEYYRIFPHFIKMHGLFNWAFIR